MKSWRYRLPVCLLFALLLTAVFGVCARADNEGTCGPNLTWNSGIHCPARPHPGMERSLTNL